MSHIHKSKLMKKKWNRYSKKECPRCKKQFDCKINACPVCLLNLYDINFKGDKNE